MQGTRLAAVAGGNVVALLAALLAVVVVVLALEIWLLVRTRRLQRGYRRLMTGSNGDNLEQTLHAHLDNVTAALARVEEAASLWRDLQRRAEGCVQHVGVVRFDAFQEVGGQLSFAVALLDGNGNGVVLSSLHGRQETRVFAKPIRGGESEVALTVEESDALRQAGFEANSTRLVRVPDMARSSRK